MMSLSTLFIQLINAGSLFFNMFSCRVEYINLEALIYRVTKLTHSGYLRIKSNWQQIYKKRDDTSIKLIDYVLVSDNLP